MTIDYDAFAPLPAFIGGILIGFASALLLLFNGRVAGISGIIAGLQRLDAPDMRWRGALAAGLIAAPAVYLLAEPLPSLSVDASYTELVIAGLLVGLGTRYAAGCTSGHGVCGLARLSARSLMATLPSCSRGSSRCS